MAQTPQVPRYRPGPRDYARQIIRGRSESIDFAKALEVLEEVNKDVELAREVMHIIRDEMKSGDRTSKLHGVALVDVLFKNGNSALIKYLQNSDSVLTLGNDDICADPSVHRALCMVVDEWVNIIGRVMKEPCKKFRKWNTHLFSYRFEYIMTSRVADKFRGDFGEALEICRLFGQALVASHLDGVGAKDETVQDVFPNIVECHARLNDLLPSIDDPVMRACAEYLQEYCDLLKGQYGIMEGGMPVDIEALAEMAERGFPVDGRPADGVLPEAEVGDGEAFAGYEDE